MKAKIEDMVVVLTGASSGIGRAAALMFARMGGTVVLTARREQVLEEVAEECRQLGGRALVVAGDVTEPETLQRVAQAAVENFGRIDVWVNNAAVTVFGRLEEIPYEACRRILDTNIFGYIHGARAVLPYFREQGRGVMINLSSQNGKVGSPYTSLYATSKFAINGLAESLRMELQDAPHIQVCSVLAASIDTPLFQHGANYTGRAVKPLDPVYSAQKVARAIVRLALHPKREVVVGSAGRQMLLLRTMAPATAEKLIARRVDRNHFQKRQTPASDGNLYQPMRQWNTIGGGWRTVEESSSRGKTGSMALLGLGLGYMAWKRITNGHGPLWR
jgi:short-subunit dehydrogenase